MKKILIFSLNYYPKYVGGAEVAVKEIVERQDKNKYEFHMLTLRFDANLPKYEVIHGIHIHRIGFVKKNAEIADLKKSWLKYNKYLYQLFAAFYAMKLHLKYKYDAVWAIMAHSCGVPAGIFKLFFPNLKYILNLQEGDPLPYIESLARPFPKFLFPLNWVSFLLFQNGFVKADMVHSISTFLDNWAKNMGNKGLLVVVHNAVDVAKFTRQVSVDEISVVEKNLGKKDGEVWLITTSRLVLKNGVDNVISAVAMLPEKFHFAVLGVGPEEEKYKKLVEDLGVQNRVHFVGEIKHPEMVVYLKACDIFIRPSRSEGMGNSFVEAMATKMPVIATTEGGLSDFIFDEKTAWVVEKDNPESIKNAVLRIENCSVEKKKEIINFAYNMVLEKFDWDKIGKQMEEKIFSKI